jgi:hypothetical protein
MKLNMIVVITMWLPRRACSQAGMKAQPAPNAGSGNDRQRQNHEQRRLVPQPQGNEAAAQAADIGLPLASDD